MTSPAGSRAKTSKRRKASICVDLDEEVQLHAPIPRVITALQFGRSLSGSVYMAQSVLRAWRCLHCHADCAPIDNIDPPGRVDSKPSDSSVLLCSHFHYCQLHGGTARMRCHSIRPGCLGRPTTVCFVCGTSASVNDQCACILQSQQSCVCIEMHSS